MSKLQATILVILFPLSVWFFVFLNTNWFLLSMLLKNQGKTVVNSQPVATQTTVFLPSNQETKLKKAQQPLRLSQKHIRFGQKLKYGGKTYLIKSNPTLPKKLSNGSFEFKVATSSGYLGYTIPANQLVIDSVKSSITNKSDKYQPSYISVIRTKSEKSK
jgi:hypothetical protein